jgi:hypothetical protein
MEKKCDNSSMVYRQDKLGIYTGKPAWFLHEN